MYYICCLEKEFSVRFHPYSIYIFYVEGGIISTLFTLGRFGSKCILYIALKMNSPCNINWTVDFPSMTIFFISRVIYFFMLRVVLFTFFSLGRSGSICPLYTLSVALERIFLLRFNLTVNFLSAILIFLTFFTLGQFRNKCPLYMLSVALKRLFL